MEPRGGAHLESLCLLPTSSPFSETSGFPGQTAPNLLPGIGTTFFPHSFLRTDHCWCAVTSTESVQRISLSGWDKE